MRHSSFPGAHQSMAHFLARRLLLQFLVFAGVLVLTFLISHTVPGDPALLRAGPRASAETIAKIRHDMGLDRPLPVQLWVYVRDLLRGDLGTSILTQRPVVQDIIDHFPATFELTTASLLVVIVVGIPLGVLSAVQKDRLPDHISRVIAISGVSLPNFWLAILLIFLFSVSLGWLPPLGWVSPARDFWAGLRSLVLPAITLGTAMAAVVMRMTRSSLLEVLHLEFVRTARAKGLGETALLLRHALRNALIPVVTVVGLQAGALLGGAIITETIFALPGVGRLLVDAIFQRDFPIVQGVVLFLAVNFLLVNLLVDLTYAALDPRIRYD